MKHNPKLRLQQALKDLPQWGIGDVLSITPIAAGLTNQSYVLATATAGYVLRLNNPNAAILGVSRQNEYAALQAIAGLSFAPVISFRCPNQTYLVSEFIEGITFAEQPPNAVERKELQAIITEFQALKPDLSAINYRNQLQTFYDLAERLGGLDQASQDQWCVFQEQAQDVVVTDRVFCHGDLTPANIIRSSNGLKVIDWEFATLGEPLFDQYCAGLLDESHPKYAAIHDMAYWLEKLWLIVASRYSISQP